MKLTPYHPVLLGDKTVFPISHCANQPSEQCDGFVYDVVLCNRGLIGSPLQTDPSLALSTNSCLYAATFGHTERRGCLAHAYFGSELVVDDLKAHATWASGEVVLTDYAFLREAEGEQRVVGLLLQATAEVERGVANLPTTAASLPYLAV